MISIVMEYTCARDYVCLFLNDNMSDIKELKVPLEAYKNIQRARHTMFFRLVEFVLDASVSNTAVFTRDLVTENCYGEESVVYLGSNTLNTTSPLIKIGCVPLDLTLSFSKNVGGGFFVFEIIYVPEHIQYSESYSKQLN